MVSGGLARDGGDGNGGDEVQVSILLVALESPRHITTIGNP